MKTHLIYGIAITVVNFVVLLLCYIGGLMNVDNLGKGMLIGLTVGITVHVIGIVLGTRAAREPSGPLGFSYGKAFQVGFLISAFTAVSGTITNFTFYKLINPNYNETTIAWTKAMLENRNVPSEKIEKMEEDMREKGTITRQVRNGLIGTIVIGSIISLITSAALKRPPAEEPLTDEPPVATS